MKNPFPFCSCFSVTRCPLLDTRLVIPPERGGAWSHLGTAGSWPHDPPLVQAGGGIFHRQGCGEAGARSADVCVGVVLSWGQCAGPAQGLQAQLLLWVPCSFKTSRLPSLGWVVWAEPRPRPQPGSREVQVPPHQAPGSPDPSPRRELCPAPHPAQVQGSCSHRGLRLPEVQPVPDPMGADPQPGWGPLLPPCPQALRVPLPLPGWGRQHGLPQARPGLQAPSPPVSPWARCGEAVPSFPFEWRGAGIPATPEC